jgi:hypothetical protein
MLNWEAIMGISRATDDDRTINFLANIDGFLSPEIEPAKKPHRANPEFDKDDGFEWEQEAIECLMEGMLKLALKQIRDCAPTSYDFKSAYLWISDNYQEHIFSFNNVSLIHGYDPDLLRDGTLRLASNKINDPNTKVAIKDFYLW